LRSQKADLQDQLNVILSSLQQGSMWALPWLPFRFFFDTMYWDCFAWRKS
jgi:hypothetical protein